ncbi:type I polyketide synthase [Nostoc punctiforme]|uniref:Phenolphthiocerol/phthiocerol polyketide synthase subunit E n=1 Tax=Nostoc punctiforme (strain ATCC 29133 / PCC 73102) TaxID=63737 RepID=B2J0Y5_NOSP7|nr:beta-ketoacyl synthase [Nostoc punctiforme PCC 73102]
MMNKLDKINNVDEADIAIIGLSGRFPKAENIEQFWQNIRDGVESISFFSAQELESAGIDSVTVSHPNYVKAAVPLEDIDLFDASFFGYNPRDAEIMDPQHRIFLECACAALENAGYNPQTYSGSIGVYAGSTISNYLFNLYSNPNIRELASDVEISLGNHPDYLPMRVSFKLNLTGPSYAIQTSCSTSLVAVHVACQSLLNYECDMALAGGISILNMQPKGGYLYQEDGVLSPDGHCRAFDAKAKGTIFGSGIGIVVLKRLKDALADGDRIHALIKSSAVNNDGSLKAGFTTPSVEGQTEVIAEAIAAAGVEADTITYVEAHGTGTPIGDPIEIKALTKAFRVSTPKRGFCAIGSVKTNVGHLDAAAGIAGLIKTILALKHKQIPPSLHCEQPNPQIDFANSPFYVNTALSEWKSDRIPRRAGITSLGFGGTNAHLIVEEAPPIEASNVGKTHKLLMLSAKTNSALETATVNLTNHLKQHPDTNLADVAYTLQVGRQTFNHRRILVCHDIDDAVEALHTLEAQQVFTHYQQPCNRPTVFMFPGQGAQYVNMGRELYHSEPKFTEEVNRCCLILKPHLGLDLRDILYPSEAQTQTATQQLKQTSIIQSALFVIEYALSKLWMAWGVLPEAMIGHSLGEYLAATLSGVFSLNDALALVAARGRLMQQVPTGAMLSVQLSEQEVQPLLPKELSLAGINSPSLCVVSGSTDAIDKLQQQLLEKNISCRKLHTSHAFHSQMMDAIIEPFTELLQKVKRNPPQIPFISNVTGTWITTAEATDPHYWARHLRQTVRFDEGMTELLKQPERILLEVGPGQTLSTFAKQHYNLEPVVLTSIRHPQEQQSDVAFLLNTLGRLWLFGFQVDWSGFYANEQRYRIPLPTYPFERQRYWISPQAQPRDVHATEVSLNKKPDIADWFYLPLWKQSAPPELLGKGDLAEQKFCTLVFTDECGLGSQMVKRLEQQGQDAIAIQIGSEFSKVSECLYTLNPRQSNDYDALLNELLVQNKIPKTIIHLWSVTPDYHAESELEWFDSAQYLGFYSLLFLTQALGKQNWTDKFKITVVSNNIQSVTAEEMLCPEKATVLGPVKVIPQEYSNISCRSIDIALPKPGSWQEEKLVDYLLDELQTKSSKLVIAYRGLNRWVQTFEPVRLSESKGKTSRLRNGGVYLITEGLGNIGPILAESLAQTVQAKLVLIGQKNLPEKDEWFGWLNTHDRQDEVSCKIRKLQALEELGAEVLVLSADVTNLEQMQRAIAFVTEHFGDIHGVIYAVEIVDDKSLKSIQETSQTDYQCHFQSKANGLFVLEKVLQGRQLDFYLLISSSSSILGGLRSVAYSAANIFMDIFAQKQNQINPVPWISVNCERWELGEEKNTASRTTLAELFITPEEGIKAFQRILTSDKITQVVLSAGDLQARFDQWLKLKSLSDVEQTSFAGDIKKKLASTSLAKILHPRPNLGNDYVAPRTHTEQTLANIWQEILCIESLGINDDFFELGGHSLLAVHLIAKINNQFGKNIQLSAIFQSPTIKQLANILHDRADYRTSSPLVAIQPHGSKPPLFFVHPVGGNILCYYELSLHLDSDQPFYGLQALGLNGESQPYTRIEDMAAKYIEALREIQPNGPYFLGGWSMGGIVAFEMATQLLRNGDRVAMLAMLDSPAPVNSKEIAEIDDYNDVKILVDFATDMAQSAGKNLSGSVEQLQALMTLDEQLNYFLEQARIVNLLPLDFELEQLRCLLKVFKSNVLALQSYTPQVYPNKILYFQASDEVSNEFSNPTYIWGGLSGKPIEIITIPSNHYTIITKPHIQIILEYLNIFMNQI